MRSARAIAHTLCAGAAEAREDVRLGLVPSRLRELADGPAHHLIGNAEEAGRERLHRHRWRAAALGCVVRVDLVGQLAHRRRRRRRVERLVLRRAEDLGKVGGQKPAQHEVGVCDGEMAALAVADGPRVGLRTLGTDEEHSGAEEEAASSARRHRVDVELRR